MTYNKLPLRFSVQVGGITVARCHHAEHAAVLVANYPRIGKVMYYPRKGNEKGKEKEPGKIMTVWDTLSDPEITTIDEVPGAASIIMNRAGLK